LPETAQAPEQVADEVTPEAAVPAEDVAVADAPRGIAQREVSLDLPSIILIDPDLPVPDDPGPLPQFYQAPPDPPAPEARG
jgi:hypothetical protein